MMPSRPKRKHIPIATKRDIAARQNGVCECGCGTPIWTGRKCNVEWDHMPCLRLRDVLLDGSDYIPAQLDPRYIVARCRRSHKVKTSGSGATTAYSDIGKIKKERRRDRAPRFKHKIRSQGFRQGHRPMKGRSRWPKRKMR
jgi:hypothetical protein